MAGDARGAFVPGDVTAVGADAVVQAKAVPLPDLDRMTTNWLMKVKGQTGAVVET